MCFIFHKYTKWEQYNVDIFRMIDGDERWVRSIRRQRRHCEICNNEQDKIV